LTVAIGPFAQTRFACHLLVNYARKDAAAEKQRHQHAEYHAEYKEAGG